MKKHSDENQAPLFGDDVARTKPRPRTYVDEDDTETVAKRRTTRQSRVVTEEEYRARHGSTEQPPVATKTQRKRVPYDKRPGTRIAREFASNVWFEINGEMRPRASFDARQRVYQRGTSLTSYTYMECLTFGREEAAKIRSLNPRSIEHIDLDHFDKNGEPMLDAMRCWRITYAAFKAAGHWGSTRRGQRWMVPLSAWDVVDRHGHLDVAGGTQP